MVAVVEEAATEEEEVSEVTVEEVEVSEEVSVDVEEVLDQEDPTYLLKTKPEKRELFLHSKVLLKGFDEYIF